MKGVVAKIPKIGDAVREKRKKSLLDAAWSCAARKTFTDLTVDDVCEEAGMSKGGFYGYFKSKQELLLALLEDDNARLGEYASELESAPGPVTRRLRDFSEAMLKLAKDPARVQVKADLWSAMLTDRQVRERFSEVIDQRRALLRGWIEEGIESGELQPVPANATASILLALEDGLVLHGSLDPGAFKWPNVSRAIEVLLDGLRAKPKSS